MYIRSRLFQIQLAVQLALIAVFYFVPVPPVAQSILCGVLLCIVGIPHGSNDYLYRDDPSAFGMLKFLAVYLGVIGLYILLWWFAPILAFVLFFLMSFHHFGQSNFENESLRYLPSWLWGIWLIIVPVIFHWQEAFTIFNQMLSIHKNLTINSSDHYKDFNHLRIISLIFLGSIYLVSLFLFERKNILYYTIQFVVVTLWYWLTPLLTGFIIVFCLWHSLQSVRHQTIFFQQNFGGDMFQFLKKMLPFSAIALVAFGLYVYMRGFQISEAFILLSLITLPHVLVMHRLYHQPNHRQST
ncbi:MAG: Brp/Blh family beta-carotene 15,15'-dioxygenase [Bacteroidetes bacterium]|nr:Brp/Blh family beta-carotene 15,15'-dioxygenase [Bacteroidota bacterium]